MINQLVNVDLQKLYNFFPFKKYRKNQKEVIREIVETFANGEKVVVLEAPTGTGKSPIAITIAKYFERAHIITPQKILQNQYHKDFSELYNMMGRSNYICLRERNKFIKEYGKEPTTKNEIHYTSCANGACLTSGKYCEEENEIICPYKKALVEAEKNNLTIHNFDSFYFQRKSFTSRPLLIVDEAHNIEQKFMSFVSFIISNKNVGGTIPEYKTTQEYVSFFQNRYIKSLEEIKKRNSDNYKTFMEIESLLERIKIFIDSISKGLEYIYEFKDEKEYQSVSFKPLYISPFTGSFFNYGEKILLMSATILDASQFCKNIGIDKFKFIKMPSLFPIENREIIMTGELELRYGKMDLARLPLVINRYLKMYENERGIIHTHTDFLMREIKKIKNNRFLFKEDFKSDKELLEEHKRRNNSVIVGSGFHEGLDLRDDLSRFQLILKLPYPDLSDKQISRRKEIDHKYYGYLSCLKLVQSYGRSIRSGEDYCDTYILDKGARQFYGMNKSMLPDWFKEAIIWD